MEVDKNLIRRPSSPSNDLRRKIGVRSSSGSTLGLRRGIGHHSHPSSSGSLWNVGGHYMDSGSSESERVKVTIRVRPPRESEADAEPGMEIDPEKGTITVQRDDSTEFQFDAVLPPTASQADVYRVAASPIVADVLNGYNGTIMAYGQTGAGKTYSLSCTAKDQLGIIPRAAGEVFAMAGADTENDYRVSMSYLQIYMEMIQDLLRPSSSNMQIRESETGVYVSGAEEVEVRSQEDCLKLMYLGEKNRTVAFTKLNAHSSRSHAIAIITVEKRRKDTKAVAVAPAAATTAPAAASTDVVAAAELHEDATSMTDEGEKRVSPFKEKILVGKLFLVDLAGSERLKKSGSEGLRAVEAKSVNLSLTSLGKCISARADPFATHVPFRDSKLTRLLQESLGGNAKTSLVINVAPGIHHISESMSSLLFGLRAMTVNTRAHVNEEDEYRLLTRTLQESLDSHDDRVHSLEVVVYSQDEQLAQAKACLAMQEVQLSQLQAEMDNMVITHQRELSERNLLWEARLLEAQESAIRALTEAQDTYRENLGETVRVLNLQRDSLAAALRESQSRLAELEQYVRELESRNKAMEAERNEIEDSLRESIMALEVGPKSKGQSAASLIQLLFRARRENSVSPGRASSVEAQERLQSQLDSLAIATGHQLVAESISHVTSAVFGLKHRFLTPRSKF